MRNRLETSFGADLSAVRVHGETGAASAADRLGAGAFAFGPNIVLGSRARADDVGLMAHEAAHTIQQGGALALQRFSAGSGDSHESEAHRASEAVVRGERFSVTGRTAGSRVQGLFGISSPLDFLADKANLIPGFRMFTIILGMNPINMSRVERNAANILRALIEFLPGGGLIVQALDGYGIFEKVGSWVEQQIQTLGMAGSAIKAAVTDFIGSLGLSDLGNLGGVWERAKRIFTEPIDRIISFAKGLVTGIITFIKDAILMPLAKLAEGTRGWDLLTAVLGRNPITGEAVPRTAETLIPGFMKLIGQEEIWENMKKANAIARAWAWFQGAMNALMGFVSQIPTLAVNAFKSLELTDIVLLPRAFAKVAAVFGNFIGNFNTWAGTAVWNLLEIIFDVVAPKAIPYLKKVGGAIKSIFKAPIPFVGNLVKAGKMGFDRFADNVGTHLKNSMIEWLTGSLPGVYIPKALEIREILKFVLSVLGLTWQSIRQKLVKATSETVVVALETGFKLVKTLVTEGPAAAWEEIKDMLSDLKDKVIKGLIDMVVTTLVKKAVAKVVSLLIPGGAFIQAILTIYDTIMVFVAKLKTIAQVVTAFLDSMMAIAGGVLDGAAKKIESTLAGLLTLAISFLAGFAGLGKVSDKVMEIIKKIRAPIDKALDKLITVIVNGAKKLWGKVKQGVANWWKATKEFTTASGEKHTLLLKGEGANAKLIIKSDPTPYQDFINGLTEPNDAKGKKAAALKIAEQIDLAIKNAAKSDGQTNAALKPVDLKNDPSKIIVDLLAKLAEATAPLLAAASGTTSSPTVYGPLQNGYGTSAQVAKLTSVHPAGSEPGVKGGTWDDLVERKLGGGSYYVRGHLLNHNLGGTGASWQNLTPLTQNSNNRALESMLKLFETPVKEAVAKDDMTFLVKVNYGRSVPLEAEAKKLAKDPDANQHLIGRIILAEKYVPLTLDCSSSKLDKAGKKPPAPFKVVTIRNEIQNTAVEQYQTTAKTRPTLKLFSADAAKMAEVGISVPIRTIIQSKKPKEWDQFREVTGFTPGQQDAMRFHFKYRSALE